MTRGRVAPFSGSKAAEHAYRFSGFGSVSFGGGWGRVNFPIWALGSFLGDGWLGRGDSFIKEGEIPVS